MCCLEAGGRGLNCASSNGQDAVDGFGDEQNGMAVDIPMISGLRSATTEGWHCTLCSFKVFISFDRCSFFFKKISHIELLICVIMYIYPDPSKARAALAIFYFKLKKKTSSTEYTLRNSDRCPVTDKQYAVRVKQNEVN